jgi:hypothetical protein
MGQALQVRQGSQDRGPARGPQESLAAGRRLSVAHYIAYHNAERRHFSFDYQSPNQFEVYFQPTS